MTVTDLRRKISAIDTVMGEVLPGLQLQDETVANDPLPPGTLSAAAAAGIESLYPSSSMTTAKAIQIIMSEKPDTAFGASELRRMVQERWPSLLEPGDITSVMNAISRLKRRGEIQGVELKRGRRPGTYRILKLLSGGGAAA